MDDKFLNTYLEIISENTKGRIVGTLLGGPVAGMVGDALTGKDDDKKEEEKKDQANEIEEADSDEEDVNSTHSANEQKAKADDSDPYTKACALIKDSVAKNELSNEYADLFIDSLAELTFIFDQADVSIKNLSRETFDYPGSDKTKGFAIVIEFANGNKISGEPWTRKGRNLIRWRATR